MRPLLLLLTLFCAHACVENRLTTYMLVQQAGPGVGAETNEKKGRLRLSQTPRELSVFAPDAEALEELAEDLKLITASKYHRLPPLTFLRFEFENRSEQVWKLHLSTVRFTAGDRAFGVVTAEDYAKRFTSVAYQYFRYDAMYASYITRRGDNKPRGEFWFEKKAPHEVVEVAPSEAGFQVLPFEFIPPGVEELVMHFTLEGQAEQRLLVRLTTERGS